MNRIIAAFRNAGIRLSRYATMGRWLLAVGRQHALMPMLVVPFLSTTAVGLHILSFVSVSRYLGFVQTAPEKALHGIETGMGLVTPVLLVAGVSLLLVCAAVARFGAARLSILAFRRVTTELTADILQKIEGLSEPVEKWRLLRKFGQRDILRIAASDGKMCGMTLRLLLDNTINLFFLLAGIFFFLWLSPALFFGLVTVFAVCALLAYPMNLKAIGLANSLEAAQKGRPERLMTAVEATLKPVSDTTIDVPQLLASENGGVNAVSSRFLMAEVFRLILGLIFAVVVGGFMWLVSVDAGKQFLDTHMLVMLFFAFRFSYQGLQGLLLCLMNINRFMPALLRTESLYRAIERARSPGTSDTAVGRGVMSLNGPLRFAWSIGFPASPLKNGAFESGKIYAVAERANAKPDLLYRLLTMLDKDQAPFSRLYLAGQADGTHATARSSWIDEILTTVDAIYQAHDGCDPALSREALLSALQGIDDRKRTGAPLIVIHHPGILSLPQPALAQLKSTLGQSILIVTGPWGPACGAGMSADVILVGSGQEIGFAAECASMTAADWERARVVYDAQPSKDGRVNDSTPEIEELDDVF